MSEAATTTAPTTTTPPAGGGAALSLATPPASTPPPATTTTSTATTTTPTPSWRDTLPAEIRNDPSLAKYQDVAALSNAYISAAKMIGGDKIPIPGKHASDADWENVFNKLGRPESPDKYDLKLPDRLKEDQGLVKSYSEAMHKAGILPKQAQSVMDWWTNFSQQRDTEMRAQIDTKLQEGQGKLTQEWGSATPQKLRQGTAAVKAFGGDELMKLLTATGLDKHPVMLKAWANAGETLKEDAIHGSSTGNLGVTPAEAKAQIASIQANKDHAYWHKEHPGHVGAMTEMQNLFGALHG